MRWVIRHVGAQAQEHPQHVAQHRGASAKRRRKSGETLVCEKFWRKLKKLERIGSHNQRHSLRAHCNARLVPKQCQ